MHDYFLFDSSDFDEHKIDININLNNNTNTKEIENNEEREKREAEEERLLTKAIETINKDVHDCDLLLENMENTLQQLTNISSQCGEVMHILDSMNEKNGGLLRKNVKQKQSD